MNTKSLLAVVLALVAGCGDDKNQCDPAMPKDHCASGTVCEEVAGGMPACFSPVVLRGTVTDPAGAPIADARVVVVDANDAPASGTAITDTAGNYELAVPTPRMPDGTVVMRQIKLHASAAGFETFPSGIRPSLPVELSTAMKLDDKMVVQTTLTHIVLTAVANAAGLGSIAGTVKAGTGKSGALVVAEGPIVMTTISDIDGGYQIFNVPAGTYTVTAYAADLQFTPASATVAGAPLSGVDLAAGAVPLGSVSGQVSIVNAPGGSKTSVVLVVESTFNDLLKRGQVPPGLRAPKDGAPDVSGAFTITGVPDGKYVVLAAFENDQLVRDPDTAIGGTQIVHITVAGAPVALSTGFKVTEALSVVSPGATLPDTMTGTPSFVWKDDSSEDGYAIVVFDERGTLVWQKNDLPRVTGSGDVTVSYAGPALTPNTYYQFRATSWRNSGASTVPISQTEDLRGVFLFAGP